MQVNMFKRSILKQKHTTKCMPTNLKKFLFHIKKNKIEPWYKKLNEEEKMRKQSHKSLKAMIRTIWNSRIGDVVDVNMIVLIRIWKVCS